MGSKTSKVEANTFDEHEMDSMKKLFNRLSANGSKLVELTKLNESIFLGMTVKTIDFLNSIYSEKKLSKITNLSFDDLVYLSYVLTKINQSGDDQFGFYYRKSTLLILYDLVVGKFGMCEETLNVDILTELLAFATSVFNSVQQKKLDFDKRAFLVSLKENILSEGKSTVNFQTIRDFTENMWYNLEPYLKAYFTSVLLKDSNYLHFNFSLPIFTSPSSFLKIDEYFQFLLLNPHVFGKPHAFKLYDCSKQGFNIPELIYSFLGFGGSIGIFIEHLEVSKRQRYVFGVFLNSNLKDCYENFCGDDLSFIFSITPILEVYKYGGSSKKICYLCRRAQNFSKMIPGIGMKNFNQVSDTIPMAINYG